MGALLLSLLPIWNVIRAIAVGAFTFFTTKPGVYFLAAGLVVGAVWYNGQRGYDRGVAQERADAQLRLAQVEADAFAAGLKRQASLDKALISAADHAGFLRGQAQARTITLTKEVPKYVTLEVDRDFPVPCALVRLHDAAAAGEAAEGISLPAGLADGDACPVKASALAQIIVENYGLDHEKDAQIIGLQDLARSLKATIEGPP